MPQHACGFTVILTAFCLVLGVQNTKLSIPLTPKRTFCFNEDLPRHTLVKLDVRSGGAPYRIQIMYLREIVDNLTSSQDTTKTLTTQKFGIYRFCLTNEAGHYNTLVFEFRAGVHAKDYASHSENADYITSIEGQGKIAEMFIKQISDENKEGLEIMNQNEAVFKKYSIQYFFTTIFIGVILLLSYFEFVTLRAHIQKRKYI